MLKELIQEFDLQMTRVTVPVRKPQRREIPLIPRLPTKEPVPSPQQTPTRKEPVPTTR